MKPNIGEKERLYRTILGVYGMLVGFFFIQGVIGVILGVLGLISLVTGLTGFCGIYYFTGKSSLDAASSEMDREQNDDN
jgi:hypothetical protein